MHLIACEGLFFWMSMHETEEDSEFVLFPRIKSSRSYLYIQTPPKQKSKAKPRQYILYMRGVPTRLVLFSQQHRIFTTSRKLHHSTKIPFTKQKPMTDRPNPALNNQPLIHKGEDVFGRPAQAEGYAQYRPNYPDELMQRLLQTLISKGAIDGTGKDNSLLVDIGTGSGQIMRKLATYFTECKGYDRSVKQLSQATQLPNVSYHEADASAIPLPEWSASVVTCAQAMHWFNIPRFLASVEKLLKKPGGVMVVLGYPR